MSRLLTYGFPALVYLTMLTGCSGGGAADLRYYIIDPVDAFSALPLPEQPMAIEIIDLQLPQYLERARIASRDGENRLIFSDTHQWGENLRKNLMRTMTRNLTTLLGTTDIGTPLNRSASQPDYRVQIYIEQFEATSAGWVVLAARWQLSGDDDAAPLSTHSATLESPSSIAAGDYDALVAAMQALFGQLASRIAATILGTNDG